MEAVAAKVAKETNDEIKRREKEDWKQRHGDLRERLVNESAA
jgi:hypothetical protein